jgi:hypothetical protein
MIAPPTYLAADYYPIQGTTVFAYSQNVEGKKKKESDLASPTKLHATHHC